MLTSKEQPVAECTLTINNPRPQGLRTEPSKHHTVGGTTFTIIMVLCGVVCGGHCVGVLSGGTVWGY